MTDSLRNGTKHPGLQVIGAGLPRTGTNSLMKALEILGYGPCHHTETIANESWPYPNSRLWQQACLIDERQARQKILSKLYEKGGFRSACDYPTALFVEDLVEIFPEALFVHGVRSSPEAWRTSVNQTIALVRGTTLYYVCFLFPQMRLNMAPLLHNGQLRNRRLFNGVDVFEPSSSIEVYQRHNDWVRKVVPEDRLLEFNPADGWEPLCTFLGVPVPRDDNGKLMEYPRTNDTAQYRRMYWLLMFMGLLSWALLLGGMYWTVRYLPSIWSRST